MALIKKCNRCGKYYTEITKEVLIDNVTYNLCPSCIEYLFNWLKGRQDLGVIKVDGV